jgi:SNF2 family DNA or RNA helicase
MKLKSIIDTNGTEFIIRFDYDPKLVAAVKQLPKRKFDGTSKHWTVPISKTIAYTIIEFAKKHGFSFTPSCTAEIQQLKEGYDSIKNEIVPRGTNDDGGIQIPLPPGKTLFPFQITGVRFAASRNSVIIADEMGLGKTAQAIVACNTIQNLKRVLIIAPKCVKLNWKREWSMWSTHTNLTVNVLHSKQEFPNGDGNVVIINYDILQKFPNITAQTWDVLIVDEAHYLKNSKTIRAKIILGCKRERTNGIPATKTIFLTGTPILAKPLDLWNLVQRCSSKFSFWDYVTRFCDAYRDHRGFWVMNGASHLDELRRETSDFLIRRLKRDVLTDLPEKIRSIAYIENDAILSVEQEAANRCGMDFFTDLQGTDFRSAFEEISAVRKETGMLKIPQVLEFTDELLQNGKKIILFAHHREVVCRYKAHYGNIAVLVHGGSSSEERDRAVTEFTNNPEIKLFIGTIGAAGVGLTLTAADTVVFGESDWTPANLVQAEDRAHRIGQRECVNIYHVVVKDSLDDRMLQLITDKQRIIHVVVDKKEDQDVLLPVAEFHGEDNNNNNNTITTNPRAIMESDEVIPGKCLILNTVRRA